MLKDGDDMLLGKGEIGTTRLRNDATSLILSLIHISEPTRPY